MKQKKYLFVISFLVCLLAFMPLSAGAQTDTEMRDIYTQAESDYQIGRIEQARDALLQHLTDFNGNQRQSALRLIALCYLARFDMEETEHYASLILQDNPYYSPSSLDPATFVDIVNSIKAGMTATITTASSQAESLLEVPVPSALITAEMIRNSGARNLQEVLATYVPGMNIIDCNDAILGKRYFDIDLLVWGSAYRNSGDRPVGSHPSYDLGLQLGYKGLQLMYDSHFSQVAAPFTMGCPAMPYDRERYITQNSYGPSFATSSRHLDLSYNHQLGNLNLKYTATYDKSDMTRYQVFGDEPSPTLSWTLPLPQYMIQAFDSLGGLSRYVNGQEQHFGFQLKGNYAYTLSARQKGNISFGAEYGHFKLDDIRYQIGYNFVETFAGDVKMREIGKGRENSANVYLQLKHQWDFSLFSYRSSLLLNAGLRFDYKNHYDDTQVRELSPRVALILLRPKWNVRLSYSKSFVDVPYLYRISNAMAEFIRNRDDVVRLSPERAHSFQLSFAGLNWVKGLNFEVNGFYNRVSDLIMTDILSYKNTSQNKTGGLELMAGYRRPRLTAHWNLTWTHTFKSTIVPIELYEKLSPYYSYNIDDNNNTPVIMSNLVVGWQAAPRLRLHAHALFESSQTSYNIDLEQYAKSRTQYFIYDLYNVMPGMEKQAAIYWASAVDAAQKTVSRHEMPAHCILNVGGEYTFGPVTIGLDIHNILGTHYNRSGMNTILIPQQGRWFMGSIAVSL